MIWGVPQFKPTEMKTLGVRCKMDMNKWIDIFLKYYIVRYIYIRLSDMYICIYNYTHLCVLLFLDATPRSSAVWQWARSECSFYAFQSWGRRTRSCGRAATSSSWAWWPGFRKKSLMFFPFCSIAFNLQLLDLLGIFFLGGFLVNRWLENLAAKWMT